MRALIVANSTDGDVGLVGERLEARGYTLERLWRDKDDAFPKPSDGDVVVLLGSDWSVYWDRIAPQVQREQQFVRRAMDRDVPVLAICYGAQLLATVLGGTVVRGATSEIGWHRIGTRHASIPDGPWMQWHRDVCVLPDADTAGRPVEVLATNDVGPQAFRCGHALATEFHPEVTTDVVRRWAAVAQRLLDRVGVNGDDLVAQTLALQDHARTQAYALVDWFCATLM
jgi:GMP synthase-like glutamine amidotransferase